MRAALDRCDVERARMSSDVRAVLRDLDIVGEGKDGGLEIEFRCRSGVHEDRHPSASIHSEPGNPRHGMIYCQSCHWSADIFELVMRVKQIRFLEAVEWVRMRGSGMLSGESGKTVYGAYFRRQRPPVISLPDGSVEIERGTICHEYLLSRGFGREEIERYGLHDWRRERRLLVPLFLNGDIISWVARSYIDLKPKVLTPPRWKGHRWGMVGFDDVDWEDPVLHLSEGWASAFRVRQAGFVNSIALCGSRMHQEQAMALSRARSMVIWREGDLAGEGLLLDVVAWLGRGREIWFVDLPRGKDPADFSPVDLAQLYRARLLRWDGPLGR